MGLGRANQPTVVEGITHAGDPAKCDVCGREVDIAQVIGLIEGPDPEMGGLANVVYLCTFCCARAIEAVTGFRAVRVLKSWYQVREAHANIHPSRIHQKVPQGDAIE